MKSILLVEDDKLLGNAIVQTLENANYQVFWARSSQEVFEALENQEFALIYMDIMLPGGVDGYEILRSIKSNDKQRSIPVIMLTNLGQMSEIDKAMDLGATDYFIKANIDLEKLVDLTKTKILS